MVSINSIIDRMRADRKRTTAVVGLLAAVGLALMGPTVSTAENGRIGLENQFCTIEFDRETGSLVGLENVSLGDEILKSRPPVGSPFRLHADFDGEWLLDADPAVAAKTHLGPADLSLAKVHTGKTKRGQWLTLTYLGAGFECVLNVVLPDSSGESEWALSVKNTGDKPRSVITEFPRIDGVQLGAPDSSNLQTVLRQGGYVDDAWKDAGDVYGKWSMQWYSIFDPISNSALGLIVEDPNVLNKRFELLKPTIAVRYFPPRVIQPGDSITLPRAKVLVCRGDYKSTARAYSRWYEKAFKPVKLPRWFAECDGISGYHFKKKSAGVKADYPWQFVLDSFRDLPAAHMRVPFNHLEYAFWSRGSMLYGKHTDGDNFFREDMGGAEAMRDAVASLHKLGMYTTFYIEGYIVYKDSELAREGKARRWSVMDHDGGIGGNYTSQGFYHMCPGCVEWQDHLATVVGRVLRETGADGIRLDSLGFYFLPCYNPEHHHASPFGYNEWVQQLLSKVRKAALEVNPDAVLTTESPVDFFGRWFHGALTQVYPRDIPPMRVALRNYRPVAYTSAGAIWDSISGIAGAGDCWESDVDTLAYRWLCAQTPIHDALVWGDVADQAPPASDPEIVTQRYIVKDYDAVVALRPACKDRLWPSSSGLSDRRGEYEVRISFSGKAPAEIAVCDVEKLEWASMRPEIRGDDIIVPTRSNWILSVVPHGPVQVVGFESVPEVGPGELVTIRPVRLAGQGKTDRVEVWSPGLLVGSKGKCGAGVRIGESVTIRVPADASPGWYQVRVRGNGVLGVRRLLHVVRSFNEDGRGNHIGLDSRIETDE